MRNLLSGLFIIFQNIYGHNDIEPEWSEADAVLSMVNWALLEIEQIYVALNPPGHI
jgi:hypothetical protein